MGSPMKESPPTGLADRAARALRTGSIWAFLAGVLLLPSVLLWSGGVRMKLLSFILLGATYAGAAFLAAAAITVILLGILRSGAVARRVLVFAMALLATLSSLALPAAFTIILGEAGSAFWFLVYLALLPATLLIVAQVSLLAGAFTRQGGKGLPKVLTTLALVGALVSPFLVLVMFYAAFEASVSFIVALFTLAPACDLALVTSLGRDTHPGGLSPSRAS